MSGDIPFGFGQSQDPDDSNGRDAGIPGQGGSGDGMPPGFGMGFPSGAGMGPDGFDAANFGAALQQLGAMMAAAGNGNDGPVNWDMALDVARRVVAEGGDPSVSDAQRRAVADAVGLADVWLDPVTQFPASAGQAIAWSRSEWLVATTESWKKIIAPVAEKMQGSMQALMPSQDDLGSGALGLPADLPPELAAAIGPLLGMARAMGSAMFGMQVGTGLAALAGEVVSSSDVGIPLTSDGHCALVPSNILAFSEGLEIADSDMMVFIALREAAHQRLFAHVPWLRSQVESAVEVYARGITVDQDRISSAFEGIDMQNPEAIQNVMASGVFEHEDTPEQKAALARLETLLALVEGWVDDVVDAAAGERLPTYDRLRETLRRRRATGGPAEKTFATLVGLELRPRRLREAASLWEQLRERDGSSGRDALWAHPDLLPTAEDLDDVNGFLNGQTDINPSDFDTRELTDDATDDDDKAN